ncbi:MAG TPA: c-type cytochrome [Burkholderiaceae bacterium]|nr:c-type cytochrome [Burkholderiaceae bacterium]
MHDALRLNHALRGLLGAAMLLLLAASGPARAQDNPPADAGASKMTPAQRAESTPKGELRNPYTGQADKEAEGRKLFMSYSCSGCHGGTGGGGMCPQVNGDVWFYGLGDDALFRLIATGSVGMQKAGFERLGGVGLQMPSFGEIIKSDDEVWKILAWIRSIYKGDPKKKTW